MCFCFKVEKNARIFNYCMTNDKNNSVSLEIHIERRKFQKRYVSPSD